MKKILLITAMALSVSLAASVAMAVAPPVVAATATATTGQPTQKITPASGGAASSAPAVSRAGGRTMSMGEYWTTFYKNYKSRGIDQTAILAITEGVQPAALLEGGLALENMNPENLIKAMYCAGYNGDDIKKASEQSGISELVLMAGFKKSKTECRQDCRQGDTQAYTPADPDPVADTQPYTPAAAPAPSMTGVPSPASSGLSYASPSTF